MKKLISLLLPLSLCISLCACNESESETDYGEYEELIELLEDENYDEAVALINGMAGKTSDSDGSGDAPILEEDPDADEETTEQDNAAQATDILLGTWTTGEVSVTFNSDGTLTYGSEKLAYSVDSVSNEGTVFGTAGEYNFSVGTITGHENAYYMYLDGISNTCYREADYEIVELTNENWEDYFVFREDTKVNLNDFGELDTFSAEIRFAMKDEFSGSVNTSLSHGSVAVTGRNGVFYCEVDPEKGTYKIVEQASGEDVSTEHIRELYGDYSEGYMYAVVSSGTCWGPLEGGGEDALVGWTDDVEFSRITGTLYIFKN